MNDKGRQNYCTTTSIVENCDLPISVAMKKLSDDTFDGIAKGVLDIAIGRSNPSASVRLLLLQKVTAVGTNSFNV